MPAVRLLAACAMAAIAALSRPAASETMTKFNLGVGVSSDFITLSTERYCFVTPRKRGSRQPSVTLTGFPLPSLSKGAGMTRMV